MRKKIILCIVLLFVTSATRAEKQHDLLQGSCTLEEVKKNLVLNQAWLPLPKTYADRKGWEKLYGDYRNATIKEGEKNLNRQWEIVKASQYLAFEKTGDRAIMEQPHFRNMWALAQLFSAEMAEGKGRFLNDIMDGTLMYCDMTTWAISAHLAGLSKEKRSVPDEEDVVMELFQGSISHLLSCIYYYLGKEIDKINPFFSRRLYKEIKRRELDPYLEREYGWMALHAGPNTMVNNWTTWCNYDALVCFMFVENDRDRLARAVWKSMCSIDKYINYVQPDGACEEGPVYWGAACGVLFQYLQGLKMLTGGKIDLLRHPLLKEMGEYAIYSKITKNWIVNFADAAPRGGASALTIYNFGEGVGSDLMKGYASWMAQSDGKIACSPWAQQIFGSWMELRGIEGLKKQSPKFQRTPCKWYPYTEFCYLDNQNGLYLACKGGYNEESHNHNDVGTSILFVDGTPILVDAGVGVYTKKTFSPERYTIWTMQSQYHNLPDINGYQQMQGREYKSRNAQADLDQCSFSLDIGGAYPKEAGIDSWVRSYRLLRDEVVIEDKYSLAILKSPNVLNFLLQGKPLVGKPGEVSVDHGGVKVVFAYDPSALTAKVETISIDDKNLKNAWGDKLYRLRLMANKMQKKGSYTVKIKRKK